MSKKQIEKDLAFNGISLKGWNYENELSPLHQKAFEQLQPLFKKYGISPQLLDGKRDHDYKNPRALRFALAVLEAAGFTGEIAHAIVLGIPQVKIIADGEYQSYPSGWKSMHDAYQVQYAVDAYINKKLQNNHRFEVGMKYPDFPLKRLVKAYKLTKGDTIEPEWSYRSFIEYGKSERRSFYETYTGKDGCVFSFEVGRAGKGGYAGFMFETAEQAMEFVYWFLSLKSHYVKDVDLLRNGLGGLSWSDLEAYKVRSKEYGGEPGKQNVETQPQ